MTATMKLRSFNFSHMTFIKSITCDLLSIDGCLPESYSAILKQIMDNLEGLGGIYEIVEICHVVIEKYDVSTSAFEICAVWILTKGSQLLSTEYEEKVSLKLMQTLYFVNYKYSSLKHKVLIHNAELVKMVDSSIATLAKHLEILIHFFAKENLREESTRLFAIVLIKQTCINDWDTCYNKLTLLPTDYSEWVNSDPHIFLRICYILCLENKVMWIPDKIMKVIASVIYSIERYTLETEMLKIICYIYPFIIPECINQTNAILGDDLLIIMEERIYELEDILSLHVSQLNWTLWKATRPVKMTVICFWLRNNENDMLRKYILHCKAQNILFDIIRGYSVEDSIAFSAANIFATIQDFYLQIEIAKLLPRASTSEMFKRLLISNPAVPADQNLATELCKFMSAIIVIMDDDEILGMLCEYSRSLIHSLKDDKDIVRVFCKDPKKFLVILRRSTLLEDNIATSIIRLIKMLLLVQQRNRTLIPGSVQIDFGYLLIGSNQKLAKCLDVLHILTSTRQNSLFMRLSQSSIKTIFLKLFSLSRIPEVATISFYCLSNMLKMNTWLATLTETNLFIEFTCSQAVDQNSLTEFLAFLTNWLKYMKMSWFHETGTHVAHTGIIKSYISRASISKTMKNHLIRRLSLLNRPRTISIPKYLVIQE
ncbi:uncharacterized protein [Diabrotica undecimpunctata]|uniref:uncharacterized protein n=1 Tax=Diabrotica undecimpunctata TaxID=50387 RepID=UPI003B63BC0D